MPRLPLLGILLVTSSPAFANAGGKISAASYVYVFLFLAYLFATIAGLFALYKFITGVINFQEEQQQEKNFSRKLAVRFLMAALLINPSKAIQMGTATVIGADGNKSGQCYAYTMDFDESLTTFQTRLRRVSSTTSDSAAESEIYKSGAGSSKGSECYTEATTNYVKMLSSELSDREQDLFEKLMSDKVRFLIGIIQVIATFFYFNAWIKIWMISEDKAQNNTYGGQVAVLLATIAVINLPRFAELVINTYASISFI